MTPETARTTEHACPRCGGDNDCALAAGRPVDACWCVDVQIDEQLLPGAGDRNDALSCLCPDCARGNAGVAENGGKHSEG